MVACGGPRILSIGLFDGIGCLRVALDLLGCDVIGHVCVEKDAAGRRVVEHHFPDSLHYDDIAEVTEEDVQRWALRYGQASLILIGAGPPCQGVSGLNSQRKGALRDERSSLFVHVKRLRELVQRCFPWGQVHCLMESVASMDERDKSIMSESFGDQPWEIDAGTLCWCSRPRLYWLSWEINDAADDVEINDRRVILTGISPGQHQWKQGGPRSMRRGHSLLLPQRDLGPHGDIALPGWMPVTRRPSHGGKETFTGSRLTSIYPAIV